ncbi:MAG: mannose-1-phosphate guanylyltransferase [Verrucomicrobia bacterium]|nr:mannose-1-phosphate guanylyltransferase [Verrucomicrobiota bacterium]
MSNPHPLYALVLAGGSGMRFWPLSRRTTPKQLLRLFGKQTLLQDTIGRLEKLVATENILVLTNEEQVNAVRAALPGHPPENIFSEPAKRDTAPAIALGVGLTAARDPDATMVVLPADARINDRDAFQSDLRAAATAAEQSGHLITIGVTPTWPCPGFGYIERGEPFPGPIPDLHEVARFREKPAPDLAHSFYRSGNFYWNAGIFVWTVRAILTELNRYAPDLGEFVSVIRNTPEVHAVVAQRFPTLRKLSIDYAILEKTNRVLVKAAKFDWDDVGSWTALSKYLHQLGHDNAANCPVTAQNSSNNVVFSDDKLHVALLGVNDLVIVQTRDALLVCNRHEAENLKHLVASLPEELQ